jgi:hypothetical protein
MSILRADANYSSFRKYTGPQTNDVIQELPTEAGENDFDEEGEITV